jgi:hypothetical protein
MVKMIKRPRTNRCAAPVESGFFSIYRALTCGFGLMKLKKLLFFLLYA